MNCININSIEFKQLAEETGLSPLALSIMVSNWQTENKTDEFPSVETITGISPSAHTAFAENLDLSKIGTPKEYTEYSKTVSNPTLDGFYEYKVDNFKDVEKAPKKPETGPVDFSLFENVEINEEVIDLNPLDKKIEVMNNFFFNGKSIEDVTISDFFESVKNMPSDFLTDEVKELIEKVKALSNVANVNIQSVDEEVLGSNIAQWDSATNTILLSPNVLANMGIVDVLSTVLHEITHSQTVAEYQNPTTVQSRELKTLVDRIFDKYYSKSDEYGFESPEEMIAEIYSNPSFVESLRELEKSTIWDNFVNIVRRLFGMSKKSEINDLIESVILNTESHKEFRLPEDSSKIYNKAFIKIRSVKSQEEKLDLLVDNIKDHMDSAILAVTHSKNLTKAEKEEAVNKIKENSDKIDTLKGAEQLLSINSYVQYTQSLAKNVIKAYKTKELKKAARMDDLSSVYFFERDVEKFGVIGDVSTYLDSMYRSNLKSITGKNPSQEDIDLVEATKELRKSVNDLNHNVNLARSYIKDIKNEMVVQMVADPVFYSKVDTQYRDIFTERFRKGDGTHGFTNEDEYISAMFQLHKDEIEAKRLEVAEDVVHTPYEDISAVNTNMVDTLNTNSALFSVATAMILQYRDKMLTLFRDKMFKLDNKYKEYKEKHGTYGSMQKMHGNLLSLSEDGQYYLKSKHTLEYLKAYKEMLEAVNAENFKDYSVFKISNIEQSNLNISSHNSIFRESNDNNHKVGDNINIQTGDKYSKLNAEVKDVDVYTLDNIEELIKKHTSFKSLKELQDSKTYLKESSEGAKKNEAVFKLLNGEIKEVTALRFKVIPNTNGTDITKTEAFKNWNSTYNNTTTEYDFEFGEEREVVTPKREYLNPEYTSLKDYEKSMLTEYVSIINESNRYYSGKNSLIVNVPGVENVKYYKLPTHNKTDLERRGEKDLKGMLRNFKQSFTVSQSEDYIYAESLDAQGNDLKALRIHNRGKINPEDQSLDLPTIFAKEYENALKYKERKSMQYKLNAIMDVSRDKQYIKKSKRTGVAQHNKLTPRNPVQTQDGKDSNEYKKLVGLLENNLYDIMMHQAGTTFAGADINKVASKVNGLAAMIALTMNEASGIANIINGSAQIHLDAIGGYHFGLKDLTAAEASYTKDMAKNLSDLQNPIKKSKTNQMLDMFDFTGGLSMLKQDFIKDNNVRKLISLESTNAYNEMGEHFMSSVLTEATLRGIKVLNSKHEFINKEGVVVKSEKEAASLYDMLEINENGVLVAKTKLFTYTTHTHNVPYNSGGKAHINALIKKKSTDMYGAYDVGLQGEFQKKWYGKSLMMFKRFFIPGLIYRYKGYETVTMSKDEIREFDINYNNSLKEYEEGYYITLARALLTAPRTLKGFQSLFTPEYYAKLSDYERANIRKAVSEIVLRFVIIPTLALLIGMGFDDDDDKPYALLYQVSRLSSELGQFSNPLDLTKMTTNPVAGMRFIQNSLELLGQVVTPLNINPTGKESHFDWLSEDVHGNNKLFKSIKKNIPVTAQFSKEYKDLYNQFN